MTTPDEHSVKSSVEETARVDAAGRLAASEPSAALAALPGVSRALDRDRDAHRFDAWGDSSAIDENTGEAVVTRAFFEALHAAAGIAADWPVGNAGLLHVYGYLFSLAETPYGRKRERWLDGALARAYGEPRGFHADVLGDAPGPDEAPTPLERVTRAAASLLAAHPVHRERIGGIRARIAIGRRAPSGPHALAYALDRGDGERLITTFPVSSPTEILSALAAGPPRLRWNATG